MAESLLQVLLDHLGSYIHGELELFFGFKNEFEKLSSMFSTIQAVLEDAQEKQLKDKALNNWLQKLNAAAYEVDDILDECKTEAARYKQSRFGRCHPGIITFRYKVGKRMKDVMEKLDAVAEERKKFHYLHQHIAEREVVRPETGYILTEPEVYGRDKETNDIVQILLNNVNDAEELSVLCIIGIGGLGKTTLAQMVFNDQRVTEHFSEKIWVCVSDDFDEKRLTKAIVESIEGRPVGDMAFAPLQTKLKELLNGKRYLLVLDDVWNEDQEKWAKLRAILKVGARGARGASVVTTTRLGKVGEIMGTAYQLSSLSQEDCQLLFMQRAFGNKEEANPNLVPIGKEIVKKCGGVPLAAKTLGSLLRFNREESEWKHVRDSEIWNLEQNETSILPALRLSYHHLPLNLRQCFVYCAVYPKDTKMEKGRMITLWIAHGFLSSKGNLELEDVGNEVWNELYLRSFFQEIEKCKFGKTYFKIHDLIHDLATSLISANTSSNNIRQLKVGRKTVRCIGFNEVVSSYSPSLLKRFVSLRVLDLSYLGIKKLPSSIGDLVHLRFLDLHQNDIRSLPKRLCKLQNLQTLDLSDCNISCLPKQISKLCSLRILLLEGCPLTSMPPRIRSLACLKTLDYFVVGETNGYQIGELQNLNLGGSLSITHLERVKKIMDAKGANLSAKANIYSLCMSWNTLDRYESQENIDEKVLEALEPHPNLKSLEITGFRGSGFPDWMINGTVLENVTSIKIDDCMKCSCLPPFGKLPRLESLRLLFGHAEYVEQDVHSTRRFPSLRLLFIEGFPNLKGLVKKGGEENFSKLEEMEITDCSSFIFPTVSSVKKLVVQDCTDATNLSSISNLTSLTFLSIDYNPAASLPEEMFKSLSNLKSLKIENFTKLKELPISLVSLTALTGLDIRDCDALECLPEQGIEGLTSLSSLNVQNCKVLKSLPEGLQYLTALNSLAVNNCPEIVALPYGLHSLGIIWFMGKQDDRFGTLESKLVELPQSLREACGLRDLRIGGFPGLVTLPDWLGDLTSLQSLIILNCPQLQALPASIMRMKNLQELGIIECGKLTKRCERGMGEDWQKIAHIPNVYVE